MSVSTGATGVPAPCAPPALEDGNESSIHISAIARFPHFAELLEASQDYAKLSGFRFRSRSFDGIPESTGNNEAVQELGEQRFGDSGTWLLAKLLAAPAVQSYTSRLQAGEPALLEELERCSRIVFAESVRNIMIVSLRGMQMWPPQQAVEGVDEDDCAYQDTSATLPVIAQRLYNAEKGREDAGDHEKEVAKLAFYIVEFAEQVGVELPAMPQTFDMMLQEFVLRMREWGEAACELESVHSALLSSLDGSDVAESLRANLAQQWKVHGPMLGAVGSVAALGALASSIGERVPAVSARAGSWAARLGPFGLGVAGAAGVISLGVWAWNLPGEESKDGELSPWVSAYVPNRCPEAGLEQHVQSCQ